MKFFKSISVSSNGSLYFCYKTETFLDGKFINIQKRDDKNFNFNQKKSVDKIESRYSFYYKKRYLK